MTVTPKSSSSPLPPGLNIVLVGRPVSAVGSHVRGVVLAELITGGVLLALLGVCGSWLIGRGLAPLVRMASAADMITSSGDLAARMPDAGERQETGRLAGAINTMLDRIQQAFGARLRSEQKVRQFAADASHELRTPLTTIRGYAELYRQGALGPGELPNAMRRIEQEAERMSMLVAELLELARLDRSSSLDLTETDLAILARDAVADAKAVEPDREVTAQLPPSLVVTADEPRIRQVLANLLGNVRAHTPPGTPAAVRLFADGAGAVVEVADNGPGMSARDAARASSTGSTAAGRGAGGAARMAAAWVAGAFLRRPLRAEREAAGRWARYSMPRRQRAWPVHRARDRRGARRLRAAMVRAWRRHHRPDVDPAHEPPGTPGAPEALLAAAALSLSLSLEKWHSSGSKIVWNRCLAFLAARVTETPNISRKNDLELLTECLSRHIWRHPRRDASVRDESDLLIRTKGGHSLHGRLMA